jgi:hypothetical protein
MKLIMTPHILNAKEEKQLTNYYYSGSTAICWALADFSVSRSHTESAGLLGRGISRRKSVTYTQKNTNIE